MGATSVSRSPIPQTTTLSSMTPSLAILLPLPRQPLSPEMLSPTTNTIPLLNVQLHIFQHYINQASILCYNKPYNDLTGNHRYYFCGNSDFCGLFHNLDEA